MKLDERIAGYIRQAKEKSLLRTLRNVERWEECRLMVDGRQVIDFSSSDYLSLAADREVLALVQKMVHDHGLGTASSPLITGHTRLHMALEERLASIYGQETALIFPSGWQANVTTIPALFGESDVLFSDERNHASLIDGQRLSSSEVRVFGHLDYAGLESELDGLSREGGNDKLTGIISDTVFSIEGDLADVKKLCGLARKYEAVLILDAAHGLPAIEAGGDSAVGFGEYLGKADVVTTSMGKYFAVGGGMVACSRKTREMLVNRARGYIYSGSVSPLMITAILAVLHRLEADPSIIQGLKENIEYVRSNLADMGLVARAVTGEGPICAVPVKPGKALEAGDKLVEKGLLATPIRYPSVPEGEARLRISIMRGHTREMMDQLFEGLGELMVEGYMPES